MIGAYSYNFGVLLSMEIFFVKNYAPISYGMRTMVTTE